MMLPYPRLGTQVFQIDPGRFGITRGHAGQEGLRHITGEGFDDGIVWLDPGGVIHVAIATRPPRTNLHARQALHGAPVSSSGASRAKLARSSTHSRTACPCSCASWRASRQQTPMSPKLSITVQKMSQERIGMAGEGHAGGARAELL